MDHKKSEKELTLSAPAWIKSLLVPTYVLPLILLFFEDWHSVTESLNPSRFPFKWIAFGLFIFGGPILCLFILFSKTVFTETEIIHRNFILQKKVKPYADVVNVEITSRNDVLISFRDGTKIKANTGESRLVETIKILKEHLDPKIFEWNRRN